MNSQLFRDAEERARVDLKIARESSLWLQAVAYLGRELRHDASEIRKAITANPNNHEWVWPYHFYWGMQVRNMLRENGFGEKEFVIGNLDNIYVELVEEAMTNG